MLLEFVAGAARLLIYVVFWLVKKLCPCCTKSAPTHSDSDDVYYVEICDETEVDSSGAVAPHTNEITDETEEFRKFDPSDVVFREFSDNEDKPPISKWFLVCIKAAIGMTVLPLVAVTIPCALIILFNHLFVNVCYDILDNWKSLDKEILRVVFYSTLGQTLFIDFWYFSVAVMMFPKIMFRLGIVLTILALALLDLMLLSIQASTNYNDLFDSSEGRIVWFTIMIVISVAISSNFQSLRCRQAFCMGFKLSLPFFLGFILLILMTEWGAPYFVKSTGKIKVAMAAFVPLPGTLCKLLSRHAANTFHNIVHPGRKFLLALPMYVGCNIVYRFFQANVENFQGFLTLSIVHAVVGCLERTSVLFRDDLYLYLYEKCRGKPHSGSRKKAQQVRITSDIIINGYLTEISSLVITNMVISSYNVRYQVPIEGCDNCSNIDYFYRYLVRIGISCGLECFFLIPALYTLSRKANLPLIKLWGKKRYWYVFYIVVLSSFTHVYTMNRNNIMQIVEVNIVQEQRYRISNSSTLLNCNQTHISFWST